MKCGCKIRLQNYGYGLTLELIIFKHFIKNFNKTYTYSLSD